MKKILLLLVSLSSLTISVFAHVTLPRLFTDNMVLQRNTPIPIWGWAKASEKIEVQFNKQSKTTQTDKNGKWTLTLEPETAGGPYLLTIKGENTIQLKNILVGEVWLCSGQSNMEWTVGQSNNAKKEIATANNPFIRHIKVQKTISSLPQNDIEATAWQVCDSSTVGTFTGAGYFFAKNIYEKLKIPIGLINASWGGTNIETWISREGFENSSEFKEMIARMPKVNLDSLSRLRITLIEKKIALLQGAMPTTNTESFKDFAFDDSNWPELNQPQLWEQQSLGELDGMVWLRKTFVLPEADSKQNAIISLAQIDDADITYINGIKIGSTDQWDTQRRYAVPAGVLKAGRNVVAIKVTDNGGGGGIYGKDSDINLIIDNLQIPLNGLWKFQVESIKKTTNENSYPSLAYNAMIHPLIPFAFQGVLWYQGETNVSRAYQYRTAFPLLINNWRQKWNNNALPFYFVQLATFYPGGNSNDGCAWAELREAQAQTLTLPNTGMCVTTDIGNPTNIHPTNKQDVGKRLAALALKNTYKKEMICNGPTYKAIEVKDSNTIISFDNIGSGLYTPDKYGYVKGFEVAGQDRVFYFAKASIQGNTIVLSSEKVTNPIAVHFAWTGDASECNLFNKEGFPAVPFRTDQWKITTKNATYDIAQ